MDKSGNGTEIDWLGLKQILDHIIQNGKKKIAKRISALVFVYSQFSFRKKIKSSTASFHPEF